MTEKPAYLLAADTIKHFDNKNYGLAQAALRDLWLLLASEHHEKEKRKQEKESEKEPE